MWGVAYAGQDHDRGNYRSVLHQGQARCSLTYFNQGKVREVGSRTEDIGAESTHMMPGHMLQLVIPSLDPRFFCLSLLLMAGR